MLKKVILAIALAVFTVTAVPAAQVNNSSKEAAVASFLKAVMVDCDMNTTWNLLSPALQQKMIKANKNSKNAAIKAMREKLYNGITKEQLAEIKKQLQNKEVFAAMLKEALSSMDKDDVVQIKGKWYINNLD